MADDKRSRDLELLKGAVARSRNAPQQEDSGAGNDQGIMYRGQPVAGRGRGGGAPGSPSGGRRAGRARSTSSSSGGTADVKEALSKLTNLFNDGLITQAEYDAKRGEILDRI